MKPEMKKKGQRGLMRRVSWKREQLLRREQRQVRGAGKDANGRYKSGKETSRLGKSEIMGEVEKWGTAALRGDNFDLEVCMLCSSRY